MEAKGTELFASRRGPSRRKLSQDTASAGPLLEPRALLRGTLSAFVLSFVLFALVSAVVTYTALTDEHLPFIATLTGVFSVLWGGFTAGGSAHRAALIHGGLAGLLYGLLVLLLGRLVLAEPASLLALWRIAGAVICGAIGATLAPRPRLRRKP
jgi:putative membrane protein (TIGR04086 family)